VRVTIQNGAVHGLSRAELEAIVPLFPSSWARRVSHIVLYQSRGSEVTASFYPQKNALGLFWPAPRGSVSKAVGLQELLVALSIVDERDELPARVSTSLRERHVAGVADLLSRCLPLLSENAA